MQVAVLAGVPGGAEPAGDHDQQGKDDTHKYAQQCHSISCHGKVVWLKIVWLMY